MSEDIYKSIVDNCNLLNAEYGLEVAIPGKEDNLSDVLQWIPTSSTMLNLLMGEDNLGIPVGRIIELFGDFSHGKSTVAQHMMNAFQKAGGISVLLDSESGWDRARAVTMGHISERHMVFEVDTCEMGFNVINSSLRNFGLTFGDVPIIYVWDTIAASPTEGEKKGEEYEAGMMWKPRLIRRELRRLTKELPKIQATLVFVNQTIESPKPNRSGVKTTPGGGGIKFWSSQRIQVTRVKTVNDPVTKKATGIITVAKMVKNKLNPPNKSVDLPISYRIGIDPVMEVMNYLLDNSSIVNIRGAYKSVIGFGEKDLSFYEKNLPQVIKENPGLVEYLIEETKYNWFGVS